MNEALLLEIQKGIENLNEKLKFAHKEVFDSKEAADYLTISRDTILREARIGRLEHAKNGTNYIFKKEYLDRWIEKNKKV